MNLKQFFMTNLKFTTILMSILLLFLFLLLFGLSSSVFNPSPSVLSIEYGTEDIEDLHIGEKFHLDNYYITNHHKHYRFYHIDEDKRLTGYGKNDFGQLGEISSYVHYEPIVMAENVLHIDSNFYITLYLTSDGKLWGQGKNHENLLLLNSSNVDMSEKNHEYIDSPIVIMEDIKYFRCGEEFVIVLKKDGSVWWWGKIYSPDLLSGTTSEGIIQYEPIKVLDSGIFVTAGNDYMAAIKKDHSLWTWGHNSMGACGSVSIDSLKRSDEDKNFITQPTYVMKKVKMVWFDSISINQKEPSDHILYSWQNPYPHTIFIEKQDGSLWAFGKNVENRKKSLRNIETLGLVYSSSVFTPIELFSDMPYTPSASVKLHQENFSSLPKEEEVLAKRKLVLSGMTTEEKQKVIKTIADMNLTIEWDYIYGDLFNELKDPNSLSWNRFHEKGEVHIGWVYPSDVNYEEFKDEMTEEEFLAVYGSKVVTHNSYTGDDFIRFIEDLKEITHSQYLRDEFEYLIQEMKLLKDDHKVEHLYNIYYILHDMDYYLLRYGPTDVAPYTIDDSTILKYYGALKIYAN